MMLKLSVLNNINIKNGTWNKVVNTVNPKSSSPGPLRTFSVVFSCIRKSDEFCLPYVNQLNQSDYHFKNASLLWKNKQDCTKERY